MKHSILTLSLSALALAGGGVALAQAQTPAQPQPQARSVESGQRTITLAAMQERGARMFARMDANGDGILTKGEGKKRRKGPKGKKRRG